MNMKNFKYMLLIASLLLMLPSCFQDLGQNPPFDYPEQPTPPPLGEDGQIFYMSFDEDFEDYQSLVEATVIGTPGFADGKVGKAYKGATNSYLTFATAALAAPLSSEMTFGFWFKLNSNPDRGGILVISPKDATQPDNNQLKRTSGIRIFRENQGGSQRIIANVGNGSKDVGLSNANANLGPDTSEWVYITLVLASNKVSLYLDGAEKVSVNFTGISWEGCDIISIGSGAPRFTGWNHLSDNSLIDELRIFNKALTADEIKAIIAKDQQ